MLHEGVVFLRQLEAEDLDEFEALEDIADNMSLVSNSSVVRRLITPNRQRQKVSYPGQRLGCSLCTRSNRREEVVISRLQTGHSYMTRFFFIEGRGAASVAYCFAFLF